MFGPQNEEIPLSKILNNVLKVPKHMYGLDYIQHMARNFGRELNFKYVSVGRISNESTLEVSTDVFLIDGDLQDNTTYVMNAATIDIVTNKRVYSYPCNLKSFLHGEPFVINNNIESLVGAPILSHDNQVIGVFFALNETPLQNINNIENIVEFLAGRFAVEFERMQTDEQLKEMNLKLEATIEERTAHLKNALSEINLKEQQLELRYNENVNLLRMLSHDLANPLQILGMSIEALADRVPPELSRLVERMKRSTDAMGQIIFLVRELQAFGAGKKELKIEPVCLNEIIEKCAYNFQDKLKEKNITLNYRPTATNTKVLAEKISLSNNVFNNLLSNAIKFSEHNSIIDISIKEFEDKILLQLSDNGIGIPEDMLPNLFAYNRETTRPGTMGEIGTGFGLPLVKLFLDLYKVKVSVKSVAKESDDKNHGTKIELVFYKAS